MNKTGPLSLKLTPPSGVELGAKVLKRKDLSSFSDAGATFKTTATRSADAPKEITGVAKFILCQETACRPVKQAVSFRI